MNHIQDLFNNFPLGITQVCWIHLWSDLSTDFGRFPLFFKELSRFLNRLLARDNKDHERRYANIWLGYIPQGPNMTPGGHTIVGIDTDPSVPGNIEWYHIALEGEAPNSRFRPVSEIEMVEFFSDGLDVHHTKVLLSNGRTALGMAMYKSLDTQQYEPRYNNCATNCADVLDAAGLVVPGTFTRQVRERMFRWFKTLKY